jgi:hypothetical protein
MQDFTLIRFPDFRCQNGGVGAAAAPADRVIPPRVACASTGESVALPHL